MLQKALLLIDVFILVFVGLGSQQPVTVKLKYKIKIDPHIITTIKLAGD